MSRISIKPNLVFAEARLNEGSNIRKLEYVRKFIFTEARIYGSLYHRVIRKTEKYSFSFLSVQIACSYLTWGSIAVQYAETTLRLEMHSDILRFINHCVRYVMKLNIHFFFLAGGSVLRKIKGFHGLLHNSQKQSPRQFSKICSFLLEAHFFRFFSRRPEDMFFFQKVNCLTNKQQFYRKIKSVFRTDHNFLKKHIYLSNRYQVFPGALLLTADQILIFQRLFGYRTEAFLNN